MAAKTTENRLLPESREGQTFNWSPKREMACLMDSQGASDPSIAAATGFSIKTVKGIRLFEDYTVRLEEYRRANLEALIKEFTLGQIEANAGARAAIGRMIELLTVTTTDGEKDIYTIQVMAAKVLTDLLKAYTGKGGGGYGGDGERPEGGAVVRTDIHVHLQEGADGATVIEVADYEVVEGGNG